jgi:transposase-like protein
MKKPPKTSRKPSAPPAKSKPALGSKTPKNAKSGPASAKPAINVSEIARQHSVSRETLRKWRSEGLDISDEKAVASRVSLKNGRDQDSTTSEGESLSEAKTRRARADADRSEIVARREAHSVIDVAAVEELMTQLGAEMRSRLLSWIGVLPPMLEGLDASRIQAILRTKVTELLESIHSNDPWKKA